MSSSAHSVPQVSRIDAESFAAPPAVDRLQRTGIILCVVGLIGAAIGFFLSADYFYRAYLVGWIYCVGISFGSLALAMLHHLTGGGWGLLLRRHFEAAMRIIPLLFVAAIPLAFQLPRLYAWADPAKVQKDPVLQWKVHSYLTPMGFGIRFLAYFAIMSFLAMRLSRLSLEQDHTGDPDLARRMRVVSGPGIVLYALVATFASVDWMMSIETHWSSTMYGFYFIASQALIALTFAIVVAFFFLRNGEPLGPLYRKKHFHDYGKLFLAFTMLWTYLCFSQFLIIWAGNLPDEIFWYRHRIMSGWGVVALIVVFFHFVLPFALLLSRDIKRRPRLLATLAAWILVMRLVDLFWQVEPAYVRPMYDAVSRPELYWLYLAVPAALFGAWLWVFGRNLKQRPLLPLNDPQLGEVVRT
jgi:hypothetical protein